MRDAGARGEAVASDRGEALVTVRWARLAMIALLLTALVTGGLVVPLWVRATVPERQLRHVAQAFLLAAQPAYGVALAVLLAVLPVTALLVLRSRRRGRRAMLASRLLVLCAAGLFAIFIAEGGAAVWRARVGRELPLLPLRTRFEKQDEREVNVVVLGGSAAYGLPFEKWLSTGRIVAAALGDAIPDRRFRLDVLAEPGVHLEWMYQKLGGYTRKPHLVIIFSGHNEFTYRYRWSRSVDHYLDEIPSRPRKILRRLAGSCSPLCGLIQDAIEANGLGEPPPPEVTRQLVDVPAVTPEEYAFQLHEFQRRLEAIVAHCEQIGTLAVLLIPPGNDAGFEPNRSCLPAATAKAGREAFTRRFLAVRGAEQTDPSGAVGLYRELLADQPGFAEAHYRLGRLLEQSGELAEAGRHFRAARDHDGLPMRCPGDFQDVYREVAARHPQAILVDGQAVLEAASPSGIPGDTLFLDAMHPSVRGHAALAQAILESLKQRGAFGWPDATPAPKLDPARCAARFGMDAKAWKVACDWGVTFFERTAYIRYDPAERVEWIARYRRGGTAIAGGLDPDAAGLPGIGVRAASSAADRLHTSMAPNRASKR